MSEQILEYLEQAGAAINLFAVAVIVVGFAWAWGRYILRFRKLRRSQNFKEFKVELGHVLTLGLQILVLGDVIETITVQQTLQSLMVLALLVIVRTVVSWTLVLETEGHWPWQTFAEDEEHV